MTEFHKVPTTYTNLRLRNFYSTEIQLFNSCNILFRGFFFKTVELTNRQSLSLDASSLKSSVFGFLVTGESSSDSSSSSLEEEKLSFLGLFNIFFEVPLPPATGLFKQSLSSSFLVGLISNSESSIFSNDSLYSFLHITSLHFPCFSRILMVVL